MRSQGRFAFLGMVVVLATGVASCGSDPAQEPDPGGGSETLLDPHLGVDPTVPVEEGDLPQPGPTDLADLDEDDRNLALGEEHVVGGNHTTLLDVRRPLAAPGNAPRARAGDEWAGVRVRTCFESELNRQLEIGSYLFSAVSDDSYSYPGVQPEDLGWPVPQYPGYGRLAPGQCTSGWIAIPVPVDVTLTAVVQSAVTKEPVSEWAVPVGEW